MDELIKRLTANARPVRRLAAPWRRTTLWLTLSLAYAALVVTAHVLGGDPMGQVEARFLLEEVAILATACTAALAAFSSTVPGQDRRIALLPLIPLSVWLMLLGESCAQDWLRLGADALQLRSDWGCAPAALVLSVLPGAAMIMMLRRGAPLVPRVTLALGALAVAAIVNFGLRIFHIGDISVMVLVWHVGGVAVASLLAGGIGRFVLNWQTMLARSHS